MKLRITRGVPIKEFVIRFSVQTLETDGLREVVTGEYDIALDVQPHVTSEKIDDYVKMNINGDAILQELTNMVATLQFTHRVAKELCSQQSYGASWIALTEEQRRENESSEVHSTD